jgi:membrane protease YdiL (CAAX protease family)
MLIAISHNQGLIASPITIVYVAVAALFVIAVLAKAYGFEFIYPGFRRVLTHIALGIAAGVALIAATVLIAALFGEVACDGVWIKTLPKPDADWYIGVSGIAVEFLVSAFQEEILFRGVLFLIPLLFISWLLRFMFKHLQPPSIAPEDRKRILSRYTARLIFPPKYVQAKARKSLVYITFVGIFVTLVLAQAIIFGLFHGDNPSATTLSIVNITLTGVLFALIVTEIGSVWAAVSTHFAWNMTCVLLGLPVSGYFVDTGFAVLSLKLRENGMLSGGDFGLEGGIACTVVLAAIMIAYVAYSAAGASRKTAVGCIANSAPGIDENNP